MSRYAIVLFALVLSMPVLAQPVPFDVCIQSTTWLRPSPQVQAKVWEDPRYKSFAREAYEWAHDFIVMSDPQSTSGHGDFSKLSGVWTALPRQVADVLRYDDNAIAAWTATHEQASDKCASARNGYEWIEVWSLFHRVRQVQRDNNLYTVIVEPTVAGFQMIHIRHMNRRVLLRFVTPDGKELERWDESAPPNRVKDKLPPGAQPLPVVPPRK